jgi:DhnA family fructose-bisphosphate aldolase class Ia
MMMTQRVREILSYYDSENPGVRTSIARFLNHGRLAGTGKLVILPVDQGFEQVQREASRRIRRPTIRCTILGLRSKRDVMVMRLRWGLFKREQQNMLERSR